ncbi:hypothetical protein MCEMSEM18_03528 [Comamonadaceae bacterium]
MSKAKHFFDKYGIRFGAALLLAIGVQATQGDWDWAEFVGRCILAGLVVAVSFLIGAWFKTPPA